MFNKKLKEKIFWLEDRVKYLETNTRDKQWELRGDIDRIAEALGLTKQETHKIEYVKKGGPEKP